MKTKTIKQVLRKRFDEFLLSIEDPEVKALVKENSIITGGSIASLLKGEEVNDFDVYFTNRETVLAVSHYYVKKFLEGNKSRPRFQIMEEPIGGFPAFKEPKTFFAELSKGSIDSHAKKLKPEIDPEGRIKIRVVSAGVACEDGFKLDDEEDGPVPRVSPVTPRNPTVDDLLDESLEKPKKETKKERKARFKLEKKERKKPFRPVYISANAITLDNQFQLIIRFYGDAETIHDNYDFAHCTCWWRSRDGHLECPAEALECLLTNELRYKGSKYPLASIIRSRKFINRGMTINAGQYLKMCLQLNEMDLRDLTVLEDQLIGVDAAYFAEMLSHIPEDKKINNQVDSGYMIDMINKFF